jgi:purine-nucleoside phosphorylase
MIQPLDDAVAQAVAAVRQQWTGTARAALILGTGLSSLSHHIQPEVSISFSQIPGFPTATALSHRGRIVCGSMAGVPLMLLDGRCHLYEGYSVDEITLPIRLAHACGARLLILSNASGGLNPRFRSGDVMIMEDHINLLGKRGMASDIQASLQVSCSRCPSSTPYSPALVQQSLRIARRENFAAQRGIYVAVTGPNYETRAEYRFLRQIGGDAVGMSTVPEATVSAALGMQTLGLSIITNVACPDLPHTVDPHEVVDFAAAAEPRVRKIVVGLLQDLFS